MPRLVRLVRSLRFQSSPQKQPLVHALQLLKSLLSLQDPEAEERLLRTIEVHPPNDLDASTPSRQRLQFASIRDFEALIFYWQSRLSLLRLERRMDDLLQLSGAQARTTHEEEAASFRPPFGPHTDEMSRLVKNILMCSEHARGLQLRKHDRLFAHAVVVVWGVIMDGQMAECQAQEEETASVLTDHLLRMLNLTLPTKPDFTAEDMNIAADVFVGGQLRGRYAELYGL